VCIIQVYHRKLFETTSMRFIRRSRVRWRRTIAFHQVRLDRSMWYIPFLDLPYGTLLIQPRYPLLPPLPCCVFHATISTSWVHTYCSLSLGSHFSSTSSSRSTLYWKGPTRRKFQKSAVFTFPTKITTAAVTATTAAKAIAISLHSHVPTAMSEAHFPRHHHRLVYAHPSLDRAF